MNPMKANRLRTLPSGGRFPVVASLLVGWGLVSGCGEAGENSAADGMPDPNGSVDMSFGGQGSPGEPEVPGDSSDVPDDDPTSPDSPDTPSGLEPGSDDDATPVDPPSSPDLGDDSGPGALPEGTTPGGVDVPCETDVPGITPLMKLSTVQYRNTVLDLLDQTGMGELANTAEGAIALVPDDSLGDSFRGVDSRVSDAHVQSYLDVGIAVGDALAANPEMLEASVGPCVTEDTLSEECARDFLTRFLGAAYRRPLDEAEVDFYLAIDDGTQSPGDAIRDMIVVALSSPRFVYHFEIDGTASASNADLLQLTSYEIASRLSYTFWQTMPDAELFAAAEDGSLATEEGFSAQLDRVFQDPRTRNTVWQFWNEWLKLEKFTGFETARPAFQSLAEGTAIGEDGHDYYGDMVEEVRALTEVLTFDRTSTIEDLLTTNLSVTESQDLAELYGVETYDGEGDYPTLPEGTRAGLFQRAALLVSNLEQTNPFHRGAFVRRALLCDSLPQPDPNDLPPGSLDPPPLDLAQTTRERFQAKVEGNGLCEGCHASFSDIGYVLESFDALGRRRTTERVYDEQNGELLAELPIDTVAVPRIDSADETEIGDPIALTERMVASQKVEACLAENYFTFALRRPAESGSGDACQVLDTALLLRDPEQGLASAFRRVAQYDGFFQRKVGPR
jgi:hypothetical protein